MARRWVDCLGPVAEVAGAPAILFIVVVVLVGCYVILNLFVAVLLNEFADDGADDADDGAEGEGAEGAGAGAGVGAGAEAEAEAEAEASFEEGPPPAEACSGPPKPWPEDYSLCCFSPQNGVRRWCVDLAVDPRFDQVIIVAIIASSICLALDVPRLDPASNLAGVLAGLNTVWTWLFFGELVVKVVAYGFAFSEHAYVKSPWNLLDLTIVIVSFLVLLAEYFPQFETLKTLRVLRVLRPLRLLSRNAGMKLIITSLVKALPAVSNVLGVVAAFQLVFAILGMQLFMGRLGQCTDPTIDRIELCHAPPSPPPYPPFGAPLGVAEGYSYAYEAPLPEPPAPPHPSAPPNLIAHLSAAVGPALHAALSQEAAEAAAAAPAPARRRRRLKGGGGGGGGMVEGGAVIWVGGPPVGNFDDFGSAMLLLYIMSTGDAWDSFLFASMDATEAGRGPVRNDFSAAAIFSIMWVFVGCFFALNLFVGVIVDEFNRIKAESDGASATMTEAQLQWRSTMKEAMKAKPVKTPRPPTQPARRAVYSLITSHAFDGFITSVIVANVGVMACDYWGIEQDAHNFGLYSAAMLAFSYIYYVECVLKLTALGPIGYFSDHWCKFDFFLVCTSLLDQFAAELCAAPTAPYVAHAAHAAHAAHCALSPRPADPPR